MPLCVVNIYVTFEVRVEQEGQCALALKQRWVLLNLPGLDPLNVTGELLIAGLNSRINDGVLLGTDNH